MVCAAYIFIGYPLGIVVIYKSLFIKQLVQIGVSFRLHIRLIFAAFPAISACLCVLNDINHEV